MWTPAYDVLIVFACLYSARTSCGLPDYGEMKFFDVPMSFTVESTVLLNDISRRDKEVSYKLNGTLQLVPLGPDDGTGEHQLIKFTVLHPYLLGRGTHVNAEYAPLASVWDSYSKSDFYVHNRNGTFHEIYVDPSEPEELINFKRSLLSLFQFSYTPDIGNETDLSGTCEVQYEVMSDQVIRKVKRRCSGEPAGAATRRVARYSRDARGLLEVYAEDVHELHAALKARAWLRLRRAHSAAPARAPRATPADLPAALVPLPLAVPVAGEDDDDSPSVEDLEALLSEASRLTGEEAPGTRAAAAALLLPSAVRAAAPTALAALLDRAAAAGDRMLEEAYGVLGSAGSAAALAAARARLAGPHAAHFALRYYDGLALADHPDEGVVMEALRTGEEGAEGAGALLAAGAAGARLPPPTAVAVRARLLRALEICQEEECTARCLRALGNLRHADDTEMLLRRAGGADNMVARAAVGALAVGPAPALYNATRLRHLERAALGPGALGERAAALELLLARGVRAPASLLPLLMALPDHAPPELRQLAWGRLTALAERDAGLRALLAALPARDGGWAVRALPGRSVAVERAAGGVGGWRAALRASLLEHTGALSRAELTLTTTARDDTTDDVMTLVLREPDVVAGAGEAELLPTVGGVLLRPRSLRANRTVLSVLQPTHDDRGALALLGGGVLRMRRRAARTVAIRANTTGQLAARGAAAAQVEARVAGAWGELNASALSFVAPRVRLLLLAGGCAHADLAPLEVGSEVRLTSMLGAARRRVGRVRAARLPAQGRTLSLADPHASCR